MGVGGIDVKQNASTFLVSLIPFQIRDLRGNETNESNVTQPLI